MRKRWMEGQGVWGGLAGGGHERLSHGGGPARPWLLHPHPYVAEDLEKLLSLIPVSSQRTYCIIH